MNLLHKIQARLRGLIVRQKTKSAMKYNIGFSGRDNYGKYKYLMNSKIVSLKFC
jgi:hypothetical protein